LGIREQLTAHLGGILGKPDGNTARIRKNVPVRSGYKFSQTHLEG
jgi:hypothetical protein